MDFEHQVWATPPNQNESKFFAAFELERWQWALKLVAYLEDNGHHHVQLRRCKVKKKHGTN